ncbi:long-chain-acyl-CoA synthetase [Salinisphaera sp. PC39]|uniref:long-chain-acyl-CoA synthetase n=1 Tax=Salinisphaera sp. PC39 TaxID=1304156 RepID=UPI00333F537F
MTATASEKATDRVTFWDMVRPDPDRLRGLDRVGRAVGLMAWSRFREHVSIGCLVEHHAGVRPQHPALRFEGREYTYAEFNAAANRYARVLRDAGVGHGDAVAVLLDNRPETLIAVTAIVKLGAVAAMCNTKQRGETLAHSLRTVDAAAALVGPELREAFEEVRGDAGPADGRVWFVADGGQGAAPAGYRDLDAESRDLNAGNLSETARVTKSDACFYIFTSGTTGLPKASVMSHVRWLRGGAGMGLAGMRLRGDDVLYCALPLYHNNALTVSWGGVLAAGATLALARKFSVSRFWDDVVANDATAFCYIGELCRYLLQAPSKPAERRHRVRVVVGNGLRPDIWDEFKERFGIHHICEFYGASEGNLVFVNGLNLDRTAGLCPLPFAVVAYDPDTEAPVRDAKGRMRRVESGGVGLLLTKITNFAPYEGYTDADASEKKVLHDVFKDGDAWFNTGDLVRDQGWRHIAFVDRLGDTFRWKGENVATTEVENALNAHPGIEESVVYGVEVPGTDGRAGMAAITPAGSLADLDMADLARHLRERLPAYAVPVFLRPRPEQAMTGTFKYRKVELKREGYSPEDGSPVYALWPDGEAYAELTGAQRKKLDAGKARL